jgi:serine/threonine-protein kinase
MVIETMLAKNREHRYSTPDDLILDLKCLIQGESPMIAGQRPESLEALAHGEANEDEQGPSEEELMALAGVVNNRNQIIATIAMLLAVSMITNVILLTVR